jgi:hypothetical protein
MSRRARHADVVARDERQQIAARLDRVARVRHDDREHRLLERAPAAQAQVRDADSFLVDRARLGVEADAADIDRVAGRSEERHRLRAAKHRRHHHEVEQVPGAHPRIVGDELRRPAASIRAGSVRRNA